jgi:hypothetical protein
MKLDLKDLDHLPDLYSQEDVEDPIVHEHITIPGTNYNLWLTEYSEVAPDGYPSLGFGYAYTSSPDDAELGYVAFFELMAVRGPYGLGPQRDENWQPKPSSEVKRDIDRDTGRNQSTLDFGL